MNDVAIKLVDVNYEVVMDTSGDGDPVLQYEVEEMPEEEELAGWQVTVHGCCRDQGIFDALLRFVVMVDRQLLPQREQDRQQLLHMALDRIGCKCSYLLAGMLRESYDDLLIVPPMMEEGINWPEEDDMEYDGDDYDDSNEDAEEPEQDLDAKVVRFGREKPKNN